jgi:RNA polymerase primary sigma factor
MGKSVINLKSINSVKVERTSILNAYLENIRKYKTLCADEQKKLVAKAKNGDRSAKDLLINSNQRFVFAVAKRYQRDNNVMDLINEGNIGLIQAIDDYDVTKGSNFISWAVYYIRREIQIYMIRNENIVRKANNHKLHYILPKAHNAFLQKENRNPTNEELQNILYDEYNIKIKDATDLLGVNSEYIDINADASDETESASVASIMEEFNECTSYQNEYNEVVEEEEIKLLVRKCLSVLDDKEQTVLRLSYGIDCANEYDVEVIAEKIGSTKERVRQIKRGALAKIQMHFSHKTPQEIVNEVAIRCSSK